MSYRLAKHRSLSTVETCRRAVHLSSTRCVWSEHLTTTKYKVISSTMQSNRSFCIESLIASQDKYSQKFTQDDSGLDEEASSDSSDRESPRIIQQTTPFSVNDILNPEKFTRERSSPTSPPTSDAKNVVWHPWMSATRYNRPQKIMHGKRYMFINYHCGRIDRS
jgi:hypothetical protein